MIKLKHVKYDIAFLNSLKMMSYRTEWLTLTYKQLSQRYIMQNTILDSGNGAINHMVMYYTFLIKRMIFTLRAFLSWNKKEEEILRKTIFFLQTIQTMSW